MQVVTHANAVVTATRRAHDTKSRTEPTIASFSLGSVTVTLGATGARVNAAPRPAAIRVAAKGMHSGPTEVDGHSTTTMTASVATSTSVTRGGSPGSLTIGMTAGLTG